MASVPGTFVPSCGCGLALAILSPPPSPVKMLPPRETSHPLPLQGMSPPPHSRAPRRQRRTLAFVAKYFCFFARLRVWLTQDERQRTSAENAYAVDWAKKKKKTREKYLHVFYWLATDGWKTLKAMTELLARKRASVPTHTVKDNSAHIT